MLPHLPSSSPSCSIRGEEGGGCSLTFSLIPLPLPYGESKGEMSLAVAILRLSTMPRPQTRSPLSRSAGAGLGVRAALTFPPAPFLSHAAGEEGGGCPLTFPRPPSVPRRGEQGGDEPSSGDSASFNDAASSNQITPLPQRGSGARGEGGPHLPPSPLPLPRCGRGRGRVPPHLPPDPLPFPDEERKGEMSLAVALLRLSTIPRPQTRSPLSRSAGAGLGVRAARSAGVGPAYPCSLTTRQPCGTVQPLCTCVKVIYQGR